MRGTYFLGKTMKFLQRIGILAFVLVASVGVGHTAVWSQPNSPAIDAPLQDQNYKLGPGDKLRVTTFGEPDLTGEFFVGDQGNVSLPLIGSVHAQGETVAAFIQNVTQMLSHGYLKDPRVSVEILTYRPYYILGEVNKPGEYPYSSDMTVMKAAATAGGFTYRANQRRVMIKHAFELKEHSIRLEGDTPVQPGDTVRILERYF
jgi:protein involved in polysaccharide export with SLBB domain